MNAADPSRLDAVRRALGYEFRDAVLVGQALRHASVGGVDGTDNERLEFLGDAAIGLAVGALLFARHPEADEGFLTERRARLVSRANLAAVARAIGLEPLLEARLQTDKASRLPDSVLAGTLEALIGAVQIEGGYAAAEAVVHQLLRDEPSQDPAAGSKSELQHLCQVQFGCVPLYRLVEERVHALGKSFLVAAEARGRRFPAAWGRSKREAEVYAAREAVLALTSIEPVLGD
jgi:ribonuclease-3